MASGPITAWQIEGEKVEVLTDFLFLGSKITLGGNCNHEIRRRLLLGRKAMTNLDSMMKSRHCRQRLVQSRHQRIDTFELWCWRRLLRVPWTERRSNQSILREINPEYSLEGLMLKLKLQHFGHIMQRADSLEEFLMLKKIESRRRRGSQRMRWQDGITDAIDVYSGKLQRR